MSLAVSSTNAASTAARLGLGVPIPADPPDTHAADLKLAYKAMARASLGLFLDERTRGALTGEQHLQVCGRAGHEAMRAAAEMRDAMRNTPEICP